MIQTMETGKMEEQPLTEEIQTDSSKDDGIKNAVAIPIIIFAVLILATIIGGVFLALNAEKTGPALVVFRNLMLILVGLEFFVIGAALVVFLVQVARLVNMLNNEIRPMVKTTQETLQIVRGTSEFMSKYLADPVLDASAKASLFSKMAKDLGKISGVAKKE